MGDTSPSIVCPTCHKRSWSTGDIEHRYCGACHKYHDAMFYRMLFHVETVSPLTIYCAGIETDENGNFFGVEPFPVTSHPPLPEDTEQGDICLAYMNLRAVFDFGFHELIFMDGKPIERIYRKDDPIPSWEELMQ